MSEISSLFSSIKLIFLFFILFFYGTSFSSELSNYSGPGDNKDGYNSKDYETNSLSLSDRKGKSADLIKFVTMKQLGLPKLEIPKDNPITVTSNPTGKAFREPIPSPSIK